MCCVGGTIKLQNGKVESCRNWFKAEVNDSGLDGIHKKVWESLPKTSTAAWKAPPTCRRLAPTWAAIGSDKDLLLGNTSVAIIQSPYI